MPSDPISDERLADIRAYLPIVQRHSAIVADGITALLAEVDRLRAQLAAADDRCVMSPTCVFGTRDE